VDLTEGHEILIKLKGKKRRRKVLLEFSNSNHGGASMLAQPNGIAILGLGEEPK